MKIDSHQHFWKYNEREFGWINDQMKIIRKDFLPADLKEELDQSGFEGSVAVQARQSLEETAWLLELATAHDFIRGVVGWVDLRSPELKHQLEIFSQSPRFVGVRHVLQDEPDPDFMLHPEFLQGISQLSAFHLTYDVLVYPQHLPNTIKLIRQFPDQVFVLDHIAKPDIRHGVHSPWKENIQQLAAYPHISCKLSGMVTETDITSWKADDFKSYLDIILECFGPGRVMIGSDWPVCTAAGSYGEVMKIVEDYIRGFSSAEKAAVLGGNAKKIYNLGE